MSYLNITGATTLADIIQSIATMVTAAGWNVELNQLTPTATPGRRITFRKVGVSDYIHIWNDDETHVNMAISIGFNPLLPPNGSPNYSGVTVTNVNGPFPNVYLFGDSDAFHVVFQLNASLEFRHMCFGMLEKIGEYPGGTYAEGSWRDPITWRGDLAPYHHVPFQSHSVGRRGIQPFPGFVRCDVPADGILNAIPTIAQSDTNIEPLYVLGGVGAWSQGSSVAWLGTISGGTDTNAFDGRSVFHPINLFVRRPGDYFSAIGCVPNTRQCNMLKFTPGQEVPQGPNTWVVFPAFKRALQADGSPNAPDLGSHTVGYAIKKVV